MLSCYISLNDYNSVLECIENGNFESQKSGPCFSQSCQMLSFWSLPESTSNVYNFDSTGDKDMFDFDYIKENGIYKSIDYLARERLFKIHDSSAFTLEKSKWSINLIQKLFSVNMDFSDSIFLSHVVSIQSLLECFKFNHVEKSNFHIGKALPKDTVARLKLSEQYLSEWIGII